MDATTAADDSPAVAAAATTSAGGGAAADATTVAVGAQLAGLLRACTSRDAEAFARLTADFVDRWQAQRALMETHKAFVDAELMEAFVGVLGEPASAPLAWYALKAACLLARADANTQALLRAGGVGSALSISAAQGHAYGWMPAGFETDADRPVIHRPDLAATVTWNGEERSGYGYCKRYHCLLYTSPSPRDS